MDRRFLSHYNIELQHLRQTAAEFAREFPKIAGRLALDREAKEICPDPFVERLLEGFAFLAARIQLKMDAEFPRFSQALLETVYPHYLSPTPSMAVARFEPDHQGVQMAEGYQVPRGTTLRGTVAREDRGECEYRTAHAVTLWPLRITEAKYYTRDVGQLELPPALAARAGIRIRIQTGNGMPLKDLPVDRLTFFLRGADEVPVSLFEQIFARATGVVVQAVSMERKKPRAHLPLSAIRRVGLREEESLLPYGPRGFQGYRLLREYFACPARFLFFEVTGLREGIALCEGTEADLIITLKEQEVRLENRVDAGSFELFCTPVVNLFSKHLDRILLTDRFSELHVVADRTRPLDFEIFELEKVTGFGAQPEDQQEFRPFYKARDTDKETGAFYTVNRMPRVLSEREQRFGRVSAYAGSEVFISLVDSNAAPYRTDLQQLGIVALCTNRHLPIQMQVGSGRTDFSLDVYAPVVATRCLTGPTPPQPSRADGEIAWKIISHLSLNYLSLLDQPGGTGASALRDLLALYTDPNDMLARKQIEALHSAQAAPIVRRALSPGPIAFARGLEITVLFDEAAFEGTGVFLIGSVLEQFFARYVALNSFTETVVKTQQRGEIMRWPARPGSRHLI